MLELGMAPRHKRSKSYPEKRRDEKGNLDSLEASHRLKLDMGHLRDCVKPKKKHSTPNAELQNSLKEEILQLEKRLQGQFAMRCALEKALGYRSTSCDSSVEIPMPKPATELIKEIAVLELEVVHLEQYLLSLYRKAFDQQASVQSPPAIDVRLGSPLTSPRVGTLEAWRPDITSKRENSAVHCTSQSLANPRKESNGISEEKILDSSVHRCHSSLSQRSAYPTRSSHPAEPLTRGIRACHSQPLSMMEVGDLGFYDDLTSCNFLEWESGSSTSANHGAPNHSTRDPILFPSMNEYAQNTSSNVISLAEHLGTRISDHVPETPNRISEDMIKCMSSIFCKLADPPLTHHGLSSPNSSLSSISAFSPQDHCDMWSPGFRKDSSFDVRLDNPFHVEGLKEFSGPYSTMVEVPWIYRDSQKLGDIEHMLQNFRTLICRLEDVDMRKMKHEEKLAFWINIHNSLVMHAYLAYGIPQTNVKRMFLLLKAAYNVGGQTISADTIQNSILGCRMSRPGQWLRLLLTSKSKFKVGDERQVYAIDHPEPLLHFALCSGSHSDPAVRAYTPKRVLQELESAKEEYIRATFGVRKDHKILLPKVVDSFAKDSGLCLAGVMEMIQQSLPDSLRKSVKKCQAVNSRKNIEWIPHNFTFRYLISKELVK